MDIPKNESDIAPLILDTHPQEKMECCDFLQCGACTIIILFTCFKP